MGEEVLSDADPIILDGKTKSQIARLQVSAFRDGQADRTTPVSIFDRVVHKAEEQLHQFFLVAVDRWMGQPCGIHRESDALRLG